VSNRITWPSSDSSVVSFDVEKAPASVGPWSTLVNVSALQSSQNYQDGDYFYIDGSGTVNDWYRLVAINGAGLRSPPSLAFQPIQRDGSPPPPGAFELPIVIGDSTNLFAAGYTRIEVWKSTDSGNSYEEITDSTAQPAQLLMAPPQNVYHVGGLTLSVSFDGGAAVDVLFDPLFQFYTAQQVVDVVNQQASGRAALVNGVPALISATTGRASSITVTKGVPVLGLSTGDSASGKAARMMLAPGIFFYPFFDVGGGTFVRYKWRASANGAAPISDFSPQVTAAAISASGVSLSLATGRFIGLDGRPMKTSVVVAPMGPASIEGYVIGASGSFVASTDSNGFLQIPLVRGAHVRIALEGTGLVRDIVVPDSASFDLLQALADSPDQFQVQKTVPLLTRRSL